MQWRGGGLHLRNPKTPYMLITVLLYGAIYFAVARYEPGYGASTGPDEDFLLLSIEIVIFHNVQYLGLVWFHNRNRYGEADHHGAANVVNRTLYAYLAACALFSAAVYFTFGCSTGVFPLCRWSSTARWSQIGLCLWWGLAMNHYYLDQKIWRIRGDDALTPASTSAPPKSCATASSPATPSTPSSLCFPPWLRPRTATASPRASCSRT